MNQADIQKQKVAGQSAKKFENEANPEMHAAKNSMRRQGMSGGKIFSGALRQAEKYNATKRGTSNGYMTKSPASPAITTKNLK